MRTISTYNVVHGEVVTGTFERLIQSALDAGKQPYGTPFFTRSDKGIVVGHQAMIKSTHDAFSSEPLSDAPGRTGT